MTIGQRIGVTIFIVVVIILALAFLGWVSGSWNEGSDASKRIGSSMDNLGTCVGAAVRIVGFCGLRGKEV